MRFSGGYAASAFASRRAACDVTLLPELCYVIHTHSWTCKHNPQTNMCMASCLQSGTPCVCCRFCSCCVNPPVPQVEGLFGMSPPCGIDYLQAAGDLETAIDIVHHHTPQPWLAALHSLAPWATPAGRRLRDARLRLARDVYEPIMRHVEGW